VAGKGLRCQICTGCGLCPGVIAERDGRRLRILGGEESRVISDMPGTVTCPEGYRLIAADIGTTTIAMELYGKEGKVADRYVTVNPQVELGRDVISRIQAAADPEKKKRLQRCIIIGQKRDAFFCWNKNIRKYIITFLTFYVDKTGK